MHFRLHTAHLKPEHLEAVQQLATAHAGKCPLFLCFMRPGGDFVFVETHEKFSVVPSLQLQQVTDECFGEETYYVKVDTSLPERVQRWQRKADSNGDE